MVEYGCWLSGGGECKQISVGCVEGACVKGGRKLEKKGTMGIGVETLHTEYHARCRAAWKHSKRESRST